MHRPRSMGAGPKPPTAEEHPRPVPLALLGNPMTQVPGQGTAMRWATVLLVLASLFVLWPMWPPLLLAVWTAGLARPVMARLERGLRGRRRAASLTTVVLMIGLGAPIVFVAIAVGSGAMELGTEISAALARSPSARSALDTIVSPDATGGLQLPKSLGDVLALAQKMSSSGWGVISGIAGASARGVVAVFLYFVGTYVFLVDGAAAWGWVKQYSPLKPDHLLRLSGAFHETGRGLLAGVGLTTLTQGVVATIIYLALGVPRALVLGPLTGVASVIPLVGSGLVWGPIALGLGLNDHVVKAIILAVLGVAVISTVDNLLRPLFARMGSLKLPLFVLYLSIFGGLEAVGTWGVLLGPLLVRLAIEALAIFKESQPAPQVPAP